MTAKKPVLWPIFFTIFLDLLGLGLVIPVFAPLFLDPNAGILAHPYPLHIRTILLGLLIAIYPLTQFFGAPVLGTLSDRHGRKPILLISLLGTALGYLIFAFGVRQDIVPLLFIGRAVDGFTGGNVSTALSAISDVSEGSAKTKYFGLAGVAIGAGFIFGPFFGGKLADSSLVSWFTYDTPFWFAALFALINLGLINFFFAETIKEKVRRAIHWTSGITNLYRAMQLDDLRTIFIVIFLLNFGFNFFAQFFQVFLVQRFHFNESQIGDVFAYAGLWLVLSQGLLTRPLAHIFHHRRLVSWASLLLAVSLIFLLNPDAPWEKYLVLHLVALFQGLVQPNSLALISDIGHNDSQGEIFGINQSIQSIAQAIPPLISGVIVVIHPNLPIIVAAGSVLVAWFVFVRCYLPTATVPEREETPIF